MLNKEDVEKALDKIRGHLQADGGDVELVALEGNNVKVKLKGACGGCPMAMMTLQNGIARILKQEFPEVENVDAV